MPYNLVLTPATLFAALLAAMLTALLMLCPQMGRGIWALGMRGAARIARTDRRILFYSAFWPIVLRGALLVVDPPPQPNVMEEYNHIFQAQTHALGRLANPVHPLSVMVQSYQQVGWPHFMSARPPLQSIFLTGGEWIFGSPFIGNLTSVAVASLGLCWMLLGWLPRRYAAIGSYIVISSWCLFGYWINSFWCPTPIVLGGALLLGVVPRVQAEPQFRHAALFCLGLVLLAGTRPYENAIYASVILLWLAHYFLLGQGRPNLSVALTRFALPIAVTGVGIIFAQLSYNWTTTGNGLVMPYQVWRASQDITQTFIWQPILSIPEIYYSGTEQFAVNNANLVASITEGGTFGMVQMISRHSVTFRDLLGPMLFVPFICWSNSWISRSMSKIILLICCIMLFMLLVLSWGWPGLIIKVIAVCALFMRFRNKQERLPAIIILVGILITSLPSFYMSIYFAAYTGAMLLLVVMGLRHMVRWNRNIGVGYGGYVLLSCAVMPIVLGVAAAGGVPLYGPALSQFNTLLPSPRRAVISTLGEGSDRNVVFVRADRLKWDVIDPVWNTPDVDDQAIVWLRDLKPEWTAAAQQYYTGREFWLMTMEANGSYTLVPYPTSELRIPVALAELPSQDRKAALRLGAREY